MNKYFQILIFCFLFTNYSSAQLGYLMKSSISCDEFVNWSEEIEKEFQNESLDNLRSGSNTYNNLRFHLLSDKYFTPLFGKPFDKLSKTKREGIKSKIRTCKERKKHTIPMKRLDWYMWGVFTQNRAYNDVVDQIRVLRNLRKEYQTIKKELVNNSNRISMIQIDLYKGKIKNSFYKLLPSEITALEILINNAEAKAAAFTLNQSITNLLSSPNSYNLLKKLNNFKSENTKLYALVDTGLQSDINVKIKNRIKQTLEIHLAPENTKIDNFEQHISSIAVLNKSYLLFLNRYSEFYTYEAFKKTSKKYIQKKTDIISVFKALIKQKIRETTVLKDLDILKDFYLKHTASENSDIIALKSEIINKNKAITTFKEQEKERAEKEALRFKNSVRNKAHVKSKHQPKSNELEKIYRDLVGQKSMLSSSISETDLTILKNYIQNKTVDIYLINEASKKCNKIYFSERNNHQFVFYTLDNPKSFIGTSNQPIQFNYVTKLKTIINSSAWKVAQNCQSVRSHYEKIRTNSFIIDNIVYNTNVNIPFLWTSTLTQGYCSEYAVYTDCRINCNKYSDKGDAIYSFVLSKELAEKIVKDQDICDSCSD